MSIPSEEVLLNALNHEIRRDILKVLHEDKKSYTQLLNNFTVPTGKLNYHLRLLEGLIEKDTENYYQLTAFGNRAWKILSQFREEITDQERPLMKQAYLSQKQQSESFLRLMFVSRMKFKFFMLIVAGCMLIISGLYYILSGGTDFWVIVIFLLGLIIMAAGFYWLQQVRKSAPSFVSQMDRVLSQLDKEDK